MYSFVEKAVSEPYRRKCSAMLGDLTAKLKSEHDINASIKLVGSGKSNLITRNGNGGFDLDYNLVISSMPEKFFKNTKLLRETIQSSFNKIVDLDEFYTAKNHHSVIRSTMKIPKHGIPLKLEIAAIYYYAKDKRSRLILDSVSSQYIWNEAPDFSEVEKKAATIHKNNKWLNLRKNYIKKKNLYINEKYKPSYVIFAESVQEIFQQLEKDDKNE